MTANASMNRSSEPSVMSPVAGRVSEPVLMLMQLFGMRKLTCRKVKSSEYERIVASVESFDGVPDEIAAYGMVVKDALAEIIASAGIVGLEMSADGEDLKKMQSNYGAIVEAYRAGLAEAAGSSAVRTCTCRRSGENAKACGGDAKDCASVDVSRLSEDAKADPESPAQADA